MTDFKIFHGLSDNVGLKDAYQNMQKNYVFSKEDILPFEFIISQWEKLEKVLRDL